MILPAVVLMRMFGLLTRQPAAPDGTDAEAMLLLWRDAAEQNDVDPADPASLVLLGTGPVHPVSPGAPPPHGMGAHVAAVHQAHGWMSAQSAVTPGAAEDKQAEAGVAVAMVLLRLAAFETDMLITYNLPAPRPDSPHIDTDPVANMWQQQAQEGPGQAASVVACVPRSHHDILSAYYATRDPSKTAEQIANIIVKRNDGGPFWWPKLCEAVQKKYAGEQVTLELALLRASGDYGDDASETQRAVGKLVWREASQILRTFVASCKLYDTGLFDAGGTG